MTATQLSMYEGSKTSFEIELPARNGSTTAPDLSGYSAWSVEIGTDASVDVTLVHGTGGVTITASSNVVTVTPGTAGYTALAALTPAVYKLTVIGTTGSETHQWVISLVVERATG